MELLKNAISQLKTAFFVKDLTHRVIFCNEQYAELAGQESPQACYAKTDEDFVWKKYASLYKEGDAKVYCGQSLVNVFEPQNKGNKIATMLLNKQPLLDNNGNISGIVGSYVEVTEFTFFKTALHTHENHFNLGANFNNAILTPREFQVLKQVLLGRSSKKIALILSISSKTVETYINNIKIKMQCKTRNDIISQAVFSGLYQQFFKNADQA